MWTKVESELGRGTFIEANCWLQVPTSCLVSASTRSSSDVFSLLGRGWYSRPRLSSVVVDVVIEVMVEGCGFREGRRLGTGGWKTEEEGDIGGEWSDDFLVGMIELFKNNNYNIFNSGLNMSILYNKPPHSLVSSFLVQLEGRRRRGRRTTEVLHDACLLDWWRRWRRGRILEEDLVIVFLR